MSPDLASARPQIVERLVELLERETGDDIAARDDLRDRPIAELSVNSLAMISFLDAVGDEFDIEWDDDVDGDAFSSLPALGDYLLAQRPAIASDFAQD
jgi:acyl carrier protein